MSLAQPGGLSRLSCVEVSRPSFQLAEPVLEQVVGAVAKVVGAVEVGAPAAA
jgi:hypothetical protein